jgi:hypothetical protein
MKRRDHAATRGAPALAHGRVHEFGVHDGEVILGRIEGEFSLGHSRA